MESYHSIYPTRVKRLINYLGNLVRTSYITRLHTYILRSNIIYIYIFFLLKKKRKKEATLYTFLQRKDI